MNPMSIPRIGACLTALLLVATASAYAQTPGMICGTVTDPSGTGMAGVIVALSGSASTPIATTTTATKGDYVFPSVAAGTYTLSFTLDGFKKTSRPGLIMTAGVERRIDQQLAPAATEQEVGTGYPPVVTTKKIVVSAASTPPRLCGASR
jgi:hypothetical protein